MLRRFILLAAFAAAPAWAQTPPAAQPAQTPVAAPMPELQAYEPSNALERAFIAAYQNEAMRPAFRRQFLDSHVFVVMQSNAPDAQPRLAPMRGVDRAAFIFTSPDLLDQRMGPETPRLALTGRAALQRLHANHVVINVGYAPMLMLDPAGVAGFLGLPTPPDSAGPSQ
jgi:hypothetical protein